MGCNENSRAGLCLDHRSPSLRFVIVRMLESFLDSMIRRNSFLDLEYDFRGFVSALGFKVIPLLFLRFVDDEL